MMNGTVKIICFADPIAEESGEVGVRCVQFEEACMANGLVAMRSALEGMNSMTLLPKCYNVGYVIGQTAFYYDNYASEEVHKSHEFRVVVESEAGKYIPAGGDEFKNKIVLMCSLKLDELMAMFRVKRSWQQQAVTTTRACRNQTALLLRQPMTFSERPLVAVSAVARQPKMKALLSIIPNRTRSRTVTPKSACDCENRDMNAIVLGLNKHSKKNALANDKL